MPCFVSSATTGSAVSQINKQVERMMELAKIFGIPLIP
jgi:hypothetical protein